MTIKRKIQLNIAILLIAVAVLSGVFIFRSIAVQDAENGLAKISSIMRETLFLSHLTEKYVETPSLITQQDWQAKHDAINNILNDAALASYQNNAAFSELRKHNNTIQSLFVELVNATGSRDLRQRLAEQVLLHAKSFVEDTAKLEAVIFNESELVRQRSTLIFFISLEVLFALAVGIAFFVIRAVSKPIANLTNVVKQIEGGDYSIHAPVRTDDEVGILGRTFNSMADKLRARTRALEAAKLKDKELMKKLDERIVELENARKAMANLFEDLEVEQHSLTVAKAKDDALLESIGEGMIAIDKDKNIIMINRVAENLLGVQKQDVLGKNYYNVFANEDAEGRIVPENKRPVSIVLSTGEKFATPPSPATAYYYIKKDGTKFPVSITVSPVILGGKIVGAIDIFRDITKEKELEKLRVDFLALASHQLRTPLSGTKWLIETVLRGITGDTTKKQRDYLNQLHSVNERMIKLVSEMLNILVLESSGVAVKIDTFSLSKLFTEIETVVIPFEKKERPEIRVSVENPGTLTVETDFYVVRDICQILISNAINYSQRGQEVVFGAKEEPDTVVLYVKDSGIGIPKEEQSLIFQRFYRAANAKDLLPGGTGLGLYKAVLLAGKIGANISFESKGKGLGTIFYLRIHKHAVDVI